MSLNTFVAVADGYQNDIFDYLKAPVNRNGSVQQVIGTTTIANASAAGGFFGLVPFQKGATFTLSNTSVHITDIDDGTDSEVHIGIVYKETDDGTDDVDAFAAASTAGQAGGFITMTNVVGTNLVTTGDGWLILENQTNTTESAGVITFNIGVSYGI